MLAPKPIYCEVAIFQCPCCGYETEVYAYYEWAERYPGRDCFQCHSSKNDHFGNIVIYREDVWKEELLNPLCAILPEHLDHCEKCIGRERIHWTEFQTFCPKCSEGTHNVTSMVFKQFTEGKHREYFYKLCEEWAKPEHPWMSFLNEDGSHFFILGGLSSGLSSN